MATKRKSSYIWVKVKTEETFVRNNSLINKKYSKDSFDRFGDDLCEVLLSFIPFSDKLEYHYELVSKQWKTVLFTKHKRLDITCHKTLCNITVDDNDFVLLLIPLRLMLFKLQFVNEIQFIANKYSASHVFDLISDYNYKYVSKLRLIIEDKTPYRRGLKKFITKCGQRLRDIYIEGISDEDMASVLKLTPNVTKLGLNGNIRAVIEQELPQLTEIHGFYYDDIFGFKSFTDLYHKQIHNISINISLKETNLDFNEVITQLMRFEKLETLLIAEDVITEDMFKMLSQMKSLTKLVICSEGLTTDGVLYLINKSSDKLSEIRVNKCFINEKTITAFVNKANKNPKIEYKLKASDFMVRLEGFKETISNNALNNNLCIKI